MIKLIFALLVCPLFAFAQNAQPRLEHDTLYTSSGYKIYQGRLLQFGNGTGKNHTFKTVMFRNGGSSSSLENASVLVKEMGNLNVSSWATGYSVLDLMNYGYGNQFIEISGTINYKDGSTGSITINMAFDKAIEDLPDLPSELTVPVEFRKGERTSLSVGLKRLFTLYKDEVIKKAQFETIKAKLLALSPKETLASPDQYVVPKFEHDTLYTTSGYKIYKGQLLQFGEGTGNDGKFKHIRVKSTYSLDHVTNKTILVEELKGFEFTSLNNGYIEILTSVAFKDGSKGPIGIRMAFDYAIENSPELPSELIVPLEFRNKLVVRISREVNSLEQLFKAKALTQEEFTAVKNKLLGG